MAYQFSLRALLRLRRIYEQRERMRLTLLHTSRGRAQNEYEEIGRQRAGEFQKLQDQLRTGLTAAEFQIEAAGISFVAARRRELAALIQALDVQVRKQAEIYSESQVRRKLLESLRDRERRAFEQVEARREQQRIDDLFAHRAAPPDD